MEPTIENAQKLADDLLRQVSREIWIPIFRKKRAARIAIHLCEVAENMVPAFVYGGSNPQFMLFREAKEILSKM